jgi:gliding motility-associated-like protein
MNQKSYTAASVTKPAGKLFKGSMKHALVIITPAVMLYLMPLLAWAQQPVIRDVDKRKASLDEVVTVKGNGFGTNAAALKVWYGGAQGTIISASDQLVETRVPAGATFDQLAITNTTTGLTGFSREAFLYSFGGTSPLANTDFQAQVDFQGESGLYDLCFCDLNNDGKVDVATANDNANSIAFFQNGSNPGSLSLTKFSSNIGARSLHATCGDLNGDGRADVVFSQGSDGSNLYILRNNGGFAFSLQSITLSGKKTKRIEIMDVDRDGKPDMVVTDQKGNSITILRNQSTLASISFAAPITISIPSATSTDGLDVSDLNGDGLPEIVTSQFLTASSNLFILQNKSTPGNINFDAPIRLTISNSVVNIRVGDLDNDAKPDIVVTQLIGAGTISVFLNQSTASTLVFSTPILIATHENPWGIDLGDLDGDGKVDIATASITSKSITVFNNQSSPGNLSLQRLTLPTTFINRHVRIGDMDDDGKPDIAFTSIDDNGNSIPASKVSIIRNKNCLVPVIDPPGPETVCSGFTLTLNSTKGKGIMYEWKNGAATVASGPSPTFSVTATGSYTVTAIAEGGSCSKVSNAVSVTVDAAAVLPPATAGSNGPVCIGSTMQLSVTNVGATEYRWSGPDNYTGTGINPAAVTNFSLQKAGRYTVEIYVGSCITQETSVIVNTVDIPEFSVALTGSPVVCQGDSKVLSVSPVVSGFDYQWFEQTAGLISGATASTLSVSSTGKYSTRVTSQSNPGCAPVQTSPVDITVVSLPVVAFNAPPDACAGQLVTFTNSSTTDPQATAQFSWDFGDGSPVKTDISPQHIFTATGTKTVKLGISYSDGICLVETTMPINITPAPPLSITNADNTFSICPGENLIVEATGGPFTSYTWSTGSTSPTATVSAPGEVRVDVQSSNGCLLTAMKTIDGLDAPVVVATSTPEEIRRGESAQLAASGLTDYSWSPTENLSDTAIPNPIASPIETTVYTVTGKGINGCTGETTVEVKIKGEAIVNLLSPSNSFSPNGDAQNDLWTIGSIENFQQCGVAIYDDKGIKIYEAKPYVNATGWDGTNNGKRLPQGVYFYIIRCEGQEGTPRTGSITILR